MHTSIFLTCLIAAGVCVDWSTIPSQPPPPTPTDTPYLGWCMCDLTLQCDPNCCCDPDCTGPEVDRFEYCKMEAWGNSTLPYCVPRYSLPTVATINHERSYVTSYDEAQMESNHDMFRELKRVGNDMLCIVTETESASGSKYFNDPGPLSREQVDTATVDITDSWQPNPLPTLEDGTYVVGDRIPAFSGVPNVSMTPWRFGGLISLPTIGFDGQCSDYNYVQFMKTASMQVCPREGLLPSLCSTALTREYLIPSAIAPFRNASNVGIEVNVKGYIFVPNGQDISQLVQEEPLQDGVPNATTYSEDGESNGVCSNAVVGVKYEFTHNSNGGITAASAIFYITDVAALATQHMAIPQAFGLTWQRQDSPYPATHLPRSGNPGYLPGKPVLAGIRVENGTKEAISLQNPSAQLTLRNGQECNSKSQNTPVRFMYDVTSSGCGVKWTIDDFKDACDCTATAEADLSSIPSHLLPFMDMASPTAIGSFGNALPDQPQDWVNLTMDAAPLCTLRTFNGGKDFECQDMTIGIGYVIIVGRFGALENPQDRIVGVKRVYIRNNVKWQGYKTDSNGMQKFWLQGRVRFIRQADGVGKNGIIQAPPVLPVLPDDFFYPFIIGSNREQGRV